MRSSVMSKAGNAIRDAASRFRDHIGRNAREGAEMMKVM